MSAPTPAANTTPAKTPVGNTAPKAPGAPKVASAMKIPANFESNPAFDEETKAKFRRELAAQERKRIRDLIRLRRDVEAEKTTAGIWARQAEEEFKSRILLPQSLLRTVKMIIILALLTFIYVAWLCGHKPTACMNTILTSATTEPRFLYLLYFMTTYIHLFAIVIMFSYFSRGTVIFVSLNNFRWL